jgi:predicted transcriptional regulator
LSIRPEHAEAIFDGTKKFEFRRVRFGRKVDKVQVYVTQPVGSVIGEFDVESVLTKQIEDLWDATSDMSGLTARQFFEYFSGKEIGHAIAIGMVWRYSTPLSISKDIGVRPPQSFMYV